MRLLVTGSRDHSDPTLICRVLDDLLTEHGSLMVVHGAARGADTTAMRWATRQRTAGLRVDHEPHPVTGLEWGRHGKRAGHLRNARMVVKGADLCIGFYKEGALNKGTENCCDQAHEAGIEVRSYPDGAWVPPEKRRQRRELLRTMTQDSIDLGLYDTTAEQLER